jgi:leader peptidase (prepilin peptidase)/N-methyltransferase
VSAATIVVVLCTVLGLLIGSFLNVVIWRVPRGESVVAPPSHCPGCDTPIAPRDNVPVLSWLVLRGRCRHCDTPIGARYPAVELLTAAMFALVSARYSDDAALPAFLSLVAVGVALAAIDLDTHRLPDVLTLPSYPVVGLLLSAAALADGSTERLARAALAGLVLYGAFFVLCIATKGRGMGFGDVKLVGVLGLVLGWLGWREVLVGVFAAFLLGSLVGLGLIAAGRAGRRTRLPFGPFLVAGTLLALLQGAEVARAWLGPPV